MKKYILIVLTAILALAAVSCKKTTEGVTEIVNFFQLNGGRSMFLGVGDEFVDPGYVELENGGKVEVSITDMYGNPVDAVTTDLPGFFEIVYHTTNAQGVDLDVNRMVYVYDSSVSEKLGTFTVDCDKSFSYTFTEEGEPYMSYAEISEWYLTESTSSYAPFSTTNYKIKFSQVAGNIYTCEDLLGGWYHYIQGRGLWAADLTEDDAYLTYYDMAGYVVLNADMTLSILSHSCDCWPTDTFEIFNSHYDKDAKRLVYDWVFAGSVAAHVEMVQE